VRSAGVGTSSVRRARRAGLVYADQRPRPAAPNFERRLGATALSPKVVPRRGDSEAISGLTRLTRNSPCRTRPRMGTDSSILAGVVASTPLSGGVHSVAARLLRLLPQRVPSEWRPPQHCHHVVAMHLNGERATVADRVGVIVGVGDVVMRATAVDLDHRKCHARHTTAGRKFVGPLDDRASRLLSDWPGWSVGRMSGLWGTAWNGGPSPALDSRSLSGKKAHAARVTLTPATGTSSTNKPRAEPARTKSVINAASPIVHRLCEILWTVEGDPRTVPCHGYR